MNYLAIDTSGKHLTVVVCREDKIYKSYEEDCGVKHSVSLMPTVEKTLSEADLSLKDVDFIACVVGAGSFTGIRIGVSTVKALCFAYNKPCISITSFDALAYNTKENAFVAIDAGHGGYYVCGYKDGKVDIPPAYALEEEALRLKGDKTAVSYIDLPAIGAKAVSPIDGLIAAINAKKDELISPDELIPLYVRKSQAEEGRK